jgi:hypothetical protein
VLLMTLSLWLGYLAALGWLAAGVLYLETRVLARHRAEAMRMLRAINGSWVRALQPCAMG